MKSVGLLVSLGFLASAGKVINFDTAPLGKTPPGWTVAMTDRGLPPRWEVLRDTTAPTQPYVLAQVSTDPTGGRAPLAILDGVTLRDGDLSVRLKPISGREGRGGGLVWRYRDSNNYYLVKANALDKTVVVFKVQDGRRFALGTADRHDFSMNAWSILKVAVRGTHFQVYVDHRRILQCQDNTFTGPGKVGLATVADSVTYFDDFRVYPR